MDKGGVISSCLYQYHLRLVMLIEEEKLYMTNKMLKDFQAPPTTSVALCVPKNRNTACVPVPVPEVAPCAHSQGEGAL